MSIELWNELQELKKRVAALESLLSLIRMGHDNLAMQSSTAGLLRKRPGPPKGYKRKPKELSA